ncbi:unnamed protein product [Rhizoctonia solani]|uniref:Uncharacterized protein n=1 Tax=Rhizoctonia solani TaxID=456999 RepID=A0A8H3CB00_9AGAM|nr:unnamed protein product [Rhizoctonia solani]
MSFIPSALNLDPYLAWSVDNDGEIQLPFEVGGYFEQPFTALFAYNQEPNNFHYEFGVPPLVDGQIEPMHDPGTDLNAIGAGVAPFLITEPGDNHYPDNRDTLPGEHLTGGSKRGNRKVGTYPLELPLGYFSSIILERFKQDASLPVDSTFTRFVCALQSTDITAPVTICSLPPTILANFVAHFMY